MKRGKLGLLVILTAFMISGWLLAGRQPEAALPLAVEIPVGDTYEQVVAWRNKEGVYCFFLPAYTGLSEVILIPDEDFSVAIDGCALYKGMSCKNFKTDVRYELSYTNWYDTEKTQILFMQSENVAAMHISTESGNMDYIHSKKGNAEDSTVRLYDAMGNRLYRGTSVEIKGRGNATWLEYEKKPYALQFPEAVDLLGMGAAERWILLANSTDPTHIKNKLIYDFADDLGLAFSPDSQWVDLYLNDEYAGLYLLTERNEIHPQRVAIQEEGWLVSSEFEDRLVRQNYPYVSTKEGMHLRIHAPDAVSAAQQEVMRSHWQSIENAILSENGIDPLTGRSWTDLIDLDSWVRRYLIEEVFANGDACAISQFYYIPEPEGAAFAGPVWDEDYTLSPRGEWRLSYPNLLAARLKDERSRWFYALYQKEAFYDHAVYVYQSEVRPMIRRLIDESCRAYAGIIGKAASMNQIRWDVPYGMEEELERSLNYLSERIGFLDQLWVNGTEMVSVQLDSGQGVYRGNILVPVGSCVGHDLAVPPENEYLVFKGWYFADTAEPFDKERPIYEDVEVFAKWEDSTDKRKEQVIKMIPLLVITVLGVFLLSKEVYLIKKHGDRNG